MVNNPLCFKVTGVTSVSSIETIFFSFLQMKRVVKTLNEGNTAKEVLCFVSQKVLQNLEELEWRIHGPLF